VPWLTSSRPIATPQRASPAPALIKQYLTTPHRHGAPATSRAPACFNIDAAVRPRGSCGQHRTGIIGPPELIGLDPIGHTSQLEVVGDADDGRQTVKLYNTQHPTDLVTSHSRAFTSRSSSAPR